MENNRRGQYERAAIMQFNNVYVIELQTQLCNYFLANWIVRVLLEIQQRDKTRV